jgi:sugar phosphate isomerase/epimerase
MSGLFQPNPKGETGMPRLAVFPKCYLDDILVRRSMTIFDWIQKAGQLDVDGLEMYYPFFAGMGDREINAVREACDSAGLLIPMLCFSPDFTHPDPGRRLQSLEEQKSAIDLAVKLGCTSCRTLSGQNRPGLDRQQAVGWCVAMIRQAAAYAGERGIVLTMENHYKDGYWDFPEFAMRAEVFLEIAGQIDSPFFGINFDPSNAIVAGDNPIELLESFKSRVVTMHASDRYLESGTLQDLRTLDRDPLHGYARIIRHGVIGKGLNDYDAIFRTLKETGFDGWVSIEDGLNGMDELRQSVEFLREKINQHFGR